MEVHMLAQDSTQIRVNFIIQSASLVLIIACFVLKCFSKPKSKEIGSVPINWLNQEEVCAYCPSEGGMHLQTNQPLSNQNLISHFGS